MTENLVLGVEDAVFGSGFCLELLRMTERVWRSRKSDVIKRHNGYFAATGFEASELQVCILSPSFREKLASREHTVPTDAGITQTGMDTTCLRQHEQHRHCKLCVPVKD